MADSQFIIALDVGGSSVKSGVVDLASHQVSGFRTTPINSQGTAPEILRTLIEIIRTHWQESDHIRAIGFGFPGPFDYAEGISRITGVEKYEAIYGMNIRDALQTTLADITIPIRFRNDAEAAIVGEGVYGVGKGYSRIIGLTLGTGCGSAFLIDGIPQTSGAGIPDNGWVYPIIYNGEMADDIFSTRGLLKRLSQADQDITSIEVALQQARNDESIRTVLAQFGDDLARFLQPLVHDFSADVVILQGGIAQGYEHFEQAMQNHLSIPILAGALDRDAALLGIANLFTD